MDYMFILFELSDKYGSWKHACVFHKNLTVLVNGYPVQENNIQRGLKQDNPLAPFLFLLVMEGLSGLFIRRCRVESFL